MKERGSVVTSTISSVPADHDEKLAPWTAEAVERLCAGYSREIGWRETDAYAFGYADGYRAGQEATEAEFDRHWAVVARQVKDLGRNSSLPYSERRRRELEWVKPRPGDFTGRLTEAEYFRGCTA